MRMDFEKVRSYGASFLKWLLLAVLTGVVVGPLGVAFGLCLTRANELRAELPWLLWLLPVGGLVIVFLYRTAGQPEGGSTNSVFMAVRENKVMPFRTAPLIFLSTTVTHLLGGSAGREGAALQLGGSVSGTIGRLLRLDDRDCRVMTMCGMSAAFAAVFGTPLAATVFTMEVISVGVMYYVALVPCLISALSGVWAARLLGLAPTSFPLETEVALDPPNMLRVIVLGALLALLSMAFCLLLHNVPKLYARFLPNQYLRIAVGGLLIVALTHLCGSTDYNGAGGQVIAAAMAGSALPWAFLLKMLFTALTLGAGYKGGEIVPVFFTGATFGCAVAPLLGLPAPFGAAVGMVALFCGVTNCPMTSIFLAAEIFGGSGLPLFALACAVSYMLSGYYGLYSEQKIVYSKFRAEFIDRKAH